MIGEAAPAPRDAVFHVEHVSPQGGKPWSDEEVQRLKDLRATHTNDAIAELLGRSHRAVRKKVHKLKLGRPYRKPMKWRKE